MFLLSIHAHWVYIYFNLRIFGKKILRILRVKAAWRKIFLKEEIPKIYLSKEWRIGERDGMRKRERRELNGEGGTFR